MSSFDMVVVQRMEGPEPEGYMSANFGATQEQAAFVVNCQSLVRFALSIVLFADQAYQQGASSKGCRSG